MKKFSINRIKLSNLMWDSILENSSSHIHTHLPELAKQFLSLEKLRTQGNIYTGSVSLSATWCLFCATNYFMPTTIAEVGTYIGKSTLGLMKALEVIEIENAQILTCDFSNDIKLNFDTNIKITQFPMQSSTIMFNSMIKDEIRADILFLDARLQKEDYEKLPNVMHENTIIILDDFEGIEKGVYNANIFMKSLNKTHNLIYHPTADLLYKYGLYDICSIAMIVPYKLITFSAQ